MANDRALTAIDVLKTIAALLMVVDHIGYLFLPEWMWLRVIGRASAPLWFMLLGYSAVLTRKPPSYHWLVYGLVVNVALYVLLQPFVPFLPLCVLFTLFAARFVVPIVLPLLYTAPQVFWGMMVCCALLGLPTKDWLEYGTIGFMWAMLGAFLARKVDWLDALKLLSFIVPAYVVAMEMTFKLTLWQTGGVVCAALVAYALFVHLVSKPRRLEAGGLYAAVFQFFGRYSLDFYTGHLVLFAVVYALLQ